MKPKSFTERPLVSIDYWLLVATAALVIIGALMVYSASFVVAHNEFNDDLYFLSRQIIWLAIGSVALTGIARVDYRRWRSLSLAAMLACLLLLIAVLIPGVGSSSYGAQRWIRFGSAVQIQPSEIAKLAIVLYLADWLARRGGAVKRVTTGSLPFVIIVGLVAVLVELQPDLGTTSIIVGAAACIFWVAGANLLHVAVLLVMGGGAAVLAIARMSGYRQGRISAFLDPFSDLQGSGWHTAQGLIALGTGGPLGVGLGASHQKFYWIPNAHTDTIFAIIGEELGFAGTFFVIVLFGIIAWRGFLIAYRAPDLFGRLFGTGLTSLIIIQALVNIAVVTNSVPYTGITLPFVSFGGNSIVISLVAVGLLLQISRHRETLVEEDDLKSVRTLSPQPERLAHRPAMLSPGSRPHQNLGQLRSRFAVQAQPVRPRAYLRRKNLGRRLSRRGDA